MIQFEMVAPAQCQKHLFEVATATCRSCHGAFCADCLVYAQGPDRPPFCIPCALTAAGVRSTASSRSRRRGGLMGRLLASFGATAAAASVTIPALAHLH